MFSTILFWHPALPYLLIAGYAESIRRRTWRPAVTPEFTYEWHLKRHSGGLALDSADRMNP